MSKCTDCGSTRLVQCSSDITCAECGLEQRQGNMINEINYMERVGEEGGDLKTCIGGSMYTSLQRTMRYVNNNNNKNDEDIFSNVHERLNISCAESIRTCRNMFRDFGSIKGTKTETRRLSLYLAIVSIVCQKTVEAIHNIFHINVSRFIHEVSGVLHNNVNWKHFDFNPKKDIIWKHMADISHLIPKDQVKEFRTKCFKIHDLITENKFLLQGVHDKGKHGAIVYLVKEKLGINLKLTVIGDVFETSVTNILYIVRKIKKMYNINDII
jgi:hypothetical protein